jgi:hypothetical protein
MNEEEAMLALLNRLLVGADQLIDSVGAWAERLRKDDSSPLVSRFIEELNSEWYDALPPDAACERITAQARERLSTWHPGWPHSWGHILRVTGMAVALAEDEGIEPVLAYVAGICHDVAKLDEFRTGEPHEEVGAQFAATVLQGHLSPAQIASIQAAIRKTGSDPLRNILYDADNLDKIGAAGIVRRVSGGVHQTWLPTALWRVMDDAWQFPEMHFDLSRDLYRRKRAFQVWFLPLAEQAVGEW